MLSSHHGKSATSIPTSSSSETSQPYYSGERDEIKAGTTETYASKLGKDEAMNSIDIARESPRKQHVNIPANMMEVFSPTVKPENISFAERLQRKDLFIATDLPLAMNSMDQKALLNSPLSPAIHQAHTPLQQQLSYPSLQHQRHARSTGVDIDHIDSDTPPANCRVPMNLPRRSSLASFMMSPPPSAGLFKSATTQALYSTNDHFNSAIPCNSDHSPKPRALQRQRSSLTGINRRHSVPNNVHNTAASTGTPSPNIAIQRLAIGNSALGATSLMTNASFLPTPTESTFRGSSNGDANYYMDYAAQISSSMTGLLPTTANDTNFSSGIHPFEIGTTSAWTTGNITGIPPLPLPLPMSTATKSATIQYLQHLQHSMIQQPDIHGLLHPTHQQQGASTQQMQQIVGLSTQPKQQKSAQPGQGSQSRRNSKAKAKRRIGSLPTPSSAPPTQSYMSAEMPWSTLSSHTQQAAAQSIFPSHQCTSTATVGSFSTAAKQQPQQPVASTSRPYYHGPAPCGNPEPLYEYLASPTVVPGLEIIGHDYYGNYVQILPICPETTCSMNQDPAYLNLLQAIYAHTIPFLDLAPGSEEETQRLMNGTPSAIATQSIQPPFKHLLPLNGSTANGNNNGGPTGSHTTFGGQSTLPASVSSPSFQQSSSNSKLLRRASAPSISSVAAPSIRRSSTVSNPSLSNPARKKKNAPRTHPYKSTSVFKEDNSMVTEAILTQVGGLGGIGNSATVSATDPRHKVAEKMVHMDETEYAAHYSKHQQSMNKSGSSAALCLAQTLATSMTGGSSELLDPRSLMSSSISAPSITNATASSILGSSASPLESIAAADFIRALSECNGGMGDLGIDSNNASASVVPGVNFSRNDLVSLENLMMMDSTAAAAVQAAAATAWPNWFDLSQLEKDVCQEGLTHQASAFSSASCSMANLPLSNSTILTSFANISRNNTSKNLLLSSSTDLAMMDDLFEDHQQSLDLPQQHSQDSDMTLAVPGSGTYHHNSTSQVLVFDQYPASNSSASSQSHSESNRTFYNSAATGAGSCSQTSELKKSISNDLSIPYTSSLLTVLPFSAQHSHPIFPTRGSRRSGWYRSKSVASQGLSEITGVDYTTTCWYDVEQLQNVVRDSISFQESSALKSLEDLTDPNPPKESTA
ncbi:hypothetical protein BGZ58_009690 [Dissophora ornata]|nr:hypothetical protein BGZ58_009690 [Dissophora ornata]